MCLVLSYGLKIMDIKRAIMLKSPWLCSIMMCSYFFWTIRISWAESGKVINTNFAYPKIGPSWNTETPPAILYFFYPPFGAMFGSFKLHKWGHTSLHLTRIFQRKWPQIGLEPFSKHLHNFRRFLATCRRHFSNRRLFLFFHLRLFRPYSCPKSK